jgi:hypothetical protein
MSQSQDRNTRGMSSFGDTLPMGAFRPNPSWYDEYWLTETRVARPRRRWATWLARLAGTLVNLRRLIGRTAARSAALGRRDQRGPISSGAAQI